ncbi:hypothetical protein [Roseiconus lacunae]|uniref:hypothetical protein n=1 Tax=Roseiconus lacunae TaxID=2605694 RepID=UPI001E340998|nr:hypothetical protein [Roseiconus lacunae]MCD0460674.1 hypothetical protein [Roseiconus lacunae]
MSGLLAKEILSHFPHSDLAAEAEPQATESMDDFLNRVGYVPCKSEDAMLDFLLSELESLDRYDAIDTLDDAVQTLLDIRDGLASTSR